jgi:aerobic-type carbon monoxide dehydrogenase small subunit (CoxS/CutS family)
MDPRTSLYDALHQLGWIGPKQFCDRGACGSCSVIIGHRPVLSCMTLACECDGKTIETSEGIADSGHPLVQAYIDNDCMQCGYCTPGFFVTAKALLDKKPKPTREEIIEAIAGNLSRLRYYPQHSLAVQQASASSKSGK